MFGCLLSFPYLSIALLSLSLFLPGKAQQGWMIQSPVELCRRHCHVGRWPPYTHCKISLLSSGLTLFTGFIFLHIDSHTGLNAIRFTWHIWRHDWTDPWHHKNICSDHRDLKNEKRLNKTVILRFKFWLGVFGYIESEIGSVDIDRRPAGSLKQTAHAKP